MNNTVFEVNKAVDNATNFVYDFANSVSTFSFFNTQVSPPLSHPQPSRRIKKTPVTADQPQYVYYLKGKTQPTKYKGAGLTVQKHEESIKDVEPKMRIFVSSTFKDMFAEREQLVKKVFPKIKALCESHGVFFSYVDLRWGITDEQSETGKTLQICLSEIDNCRPFFIGILGERYGWIPHYSDNVWDEVLPVYPWLEQHRGDKSVTNLEIFHGFLNQSPEDTKYSQFYFRKYVPSIENISDFVSENETSAKKISALKEQICQRTTVNNYQSVEEFGEMVLQNLTNTIEELFPRKTKLSDLESERLAHKILMKQHEKLFIGREKEIMFMNKILTEETKLPFVVSGPEGCGKTALLSQWGLQCYQYFGDMLIIPHFVGATTNSSNHVLLIKRIMEEISQHFKIEGYTIPSDSEKIVSEFSKWLGLASQHGKLLIILDGLNHLDSRQGRSLGWMPDKLPKNVYIVTTANTNDIIMKRRWPGFQIEEFDTEIVDRIINTYLRQHCKSLSQDQRKLILQTEQTKNALYLITFLSEITIFGSYENISQHMKHLLESRSPSDLIIKILQRLLSDYNTSQYPTMVETIFSLIRLSRNGLSEIEISEITKIPQGIWSHLFLATKWMFYFNGNSISLTQPVIQKAVDLIFLKKIDKISIHNNISEYFENGFTEQISEFRKLSMLPWHVCKSHNWEKLASLISNLEIFSKLAKFHRYDFFYYCNKLSRKSSENIVTLIDENLEVFIRKENPPGNVLIEKYSELGDFFINVANYEAAEKYLSKSEIMCSIHPEFLLPVLKSYALVQYKMGKYNNAETCFQRALDNIRATQTNEKIDIENQLGYVYGKIGNYQKAQETYNSALLKLRNKNSAMAAMIFHNLGWVYFKSSDYTKAMEYYEKSRDILEKTLGILDPEYITVMVDISEVYYKLGKYDEAENNYLNCKSGLEEIYGKDHPRVAHILSRLGYLYGKLNKFNQAKELYVRTAEIWENSVGKNHANYASAIHYLGWIEFKLANYTIAQKLYLESYEIRKKCFGMNNPETADILHDIGELYYKQGKYTESMEYYKICIEIRSKLLGLNHPSLAWTYNNMGYLYGKLSEYKLAEEYFRKAMEIWKKVLGTKHPNYGMIMHNLGWIVMKLEKYKESKRLYETALSVRKNSLGSDHPDTIDTLNDLGELAYRMKDYVNAEKLYKNCLQLRVKIFGNVHSSVGWSHNNLGLLMISLERLQEAYAHFKMCFRIWNQTYGVGKHPNCGLARHNLAKVMRSLNITGAEKMFKNALIIREKLLGRDSADTADTLLELGKLYVSQERFDDAEAVLERALSIRKRKFGENHPLVWEIHQVQIYDISKKKFGDIDLNKIFSVQEGDRK